ncbi:MAG: hypothetical protein QOJ40_793 [Verrucomicrobiota bacterium]
MLVLGLLVAGFAGRVGAQSPTFGGNAQHTSLYSVPAQSLSQLHWSTSINLLNPGDFAHYGAPLITPVNTVLVPVKKNATGFQVSAFEGATGRLKYTLATDYSLPNYSTWVPPYQPVIATPPSGARLYYAGAGGTVYYVDSLDSDTPGTPVHQCFYTTLAAYTANASAYNTTVFINTPLTAGTNGVVFFGFRVQGTAPAPLSTTQSGFARLDPNGNAVYVLAGTAANNSTFSLDSHGCAPALSTDGSTLYVAVKNSGSTSGYLLGLDSTTLATKYSALLRDPRNGSSVVVSDKGTASPMVGPDGDVFFGVLPNPNNTYRGYLLHFSADLQTQKLPSGFGWDYTPAIVPTNMVPGYSGPSSYLLFSKYNNYAGFTDGDGIDRIALLDPNLAQTDEHPGNSSLPEMREIMTVIGCTPDSTVSASTYPFATREWCINAAAVNPSTMSVFCPSEDGHIFRWNLASNSLTEAYTLGAGVSAPYVPTAIGPDGTVYTLNGTKLFALGNLTNEAMSVYSSVPNVNSFVAGQPVTFTAVVTNPAAGPVPTGTVAFQDVTYQGITRITNTLSAGVPLSNGIAVVSNPTLSASSTLGNHFITALYSGDATFPANRATLVQKVHTRATTITPHVAIGSGNTLIFSATVSSSPSGVTPTGMVSFWDGSTFLGQVPLTNGATSFIRSNLTAGSHAVWAGYASDTFCASSSANLIATPSYLTGAILPGNGAFQMAFSNSIGASFTGLRSTQLALPLSNWSVLGPATEVSPGQFLFTDPQAASNARGFYRIRSP